MPENKNILIIDDEKNIRMTIKKALENAGYTVDTAINGEDGLKKLKDDKYPLILLDMKLPGIDGLEVLERINERDYQSNVIMITGYGTVETAVETMKMGAVDYLRKPFKAAEIRDIVEEVFSRHQLDLTEEKAGSFEDYLKLAKAEINKRNFDRAVEFLQEAASLNSEKPEPFNLLGVIYELKSRHPEAMKMYRAALALDPTYKPAAENLERAGEMSSVDTGDLDKLNLGDE